MWIYSRPRMSSSQKHRREEADGGAGGASFRHSQRCSTWRGERPGNANRGFRMGENRAPKLPISMETLCVKYDQRFSRSQKEQFRETALSVCLCCSQRPDFSRIVSVVLPCFCRGAFPSSPFLVIFAFGDCTERERDASAAAVPLW